MSRVGPLVNSGSRAMASSKYPPKFDNETEYENWKRDINIWCEFTDLAEDKRALTIHVINQSGLYSVF